MNIVRCGFRVSRIPFRTAAGDQAVAGQGVGLPADAAVVLPRCDGQRDLYQVGEVEPPILGERLLKAIKGLQDAGLITFEPNAGPVAGYPGNDDRIGKYFLAKGYATEAQLVQALERQMELARKNRFMWLGEILTELNVLRPSQVQEALAYQKRHRAKVARERALAPTLAPGGDAKPLAGDAPTLGGPRA